MVKTKSHNQDTGNSKQPQARGVHKGENFSLYTIIVSVTALITLRLYTAAITTNNWKGFYISFAHLAIVAIGSALALRKASKA